MPPLRRRRREFFNRGADLWWLGTETRCADRRAELLLLAAADLGGHTALRAVCWHDCSAVVPPASVVLRVLSPIGAEIGALCR